MMRLRTWIPAALLLAVLPIGAEIAVAQFPPPPPRSAAAPKAAPVPTPPPVVGAAPAPAPAAPAPASGWSFGDVLATIVTALLGLFVGNQTKQTWWPSSPGGNMPNLAPPKNITDLLGRFTDPAKRKEMDEYLLQIVQAGIPGELLKAGLGPVPGIGPATVTLEPMIRKHVEDALAKRAAGQ